MKNGASSRAFVVMLLVALLASSCARAEDEGSSGSDSGEDSATAIDSDLGEDLMWDDGPCDESQPEVALGLIAPFSAGAISLEDQAVAARVSAEAFNERGGIAGRCINMLTCDDGADPNQAADCARQHVDEGVVAEINDSVVAAADVVLDIFTQAGVPRFEGSPAPVAMSSPTTYTLGMGGLGNSVVEVTPLAAEGYKKYAIVRADVPGAAALQNIIEPEVTAYGGEVVADIPVTSGTSDYSQFVLAAQNAGADSILLLTGPDEALQVLRAAQQLNTELRFSISLGSVSRDDIKEFGEYADTFVFNGELPPASTDPTEHPLLAVANRELSASGEEALQPDTLISSTLKSWVYMYALIKILRDAGVTDVTPATVTQAIQAAKDVDMGGLTPPWTPNAESTGVFKRISMPYYWIARWDGDEENFVVDPEQVDSVKLLAGDVS